MQPQHCAIAGLGASHPWGVPPCRSTTSISPTWSASRTGSRTTSSRGSGARRPCGSIPRRRIPRAARLLGAQPPRRRRRRRHRRCHLLVRGRGRRDGGGTLIEDLPAGFRGGRAAQHDGRSPSRPAPPPAHPRAVAARAARHGGRPAAAGGRARRRRDGARHLRLRRRGCGRAAAPGDGAPARGPAGRPRAALRLGGGDARLRGGRALGESTARTRAASAARKHTGVRRLPVTLVPRAHPAGSRA